MKPYIIAEIGSNFSSKTDCMTSISLAKACGADAVKFQLYTHKALYGFEGKLAGELPVEWLPKLKEKADAVGIDFMCSAFSPELLDVVDPLVKSHKVASAECCHTEMLEKLRKITKPVFLSVGAQTLPDIEKSLEILGDETPVTIMYCEASYPAKRIDLSKIQILRNEFKRPMGFSDHSLDLFTIPWAACHVFGAIVLEKHVNFCGVLSPDSPHSLTTAEFKDMVSTIRYRKSQEFVPTVDEQAMITTHKRRLIVTKDVEQGEELLIGTHECANFGIYRSLKPETRAASPFRVDDYNGRKAKRDLKAGDGLWVDDVE